MAPLRPAVTSGLAWPGAWQSDVAGAAVAVGDVDQVACPLPPAHAVDLADAGARRGEQLRLFLRRRGILRTLVAECLGVPAEVLVIGYDARGAPVVRVPVPRAPSRRLSVSVAGRGSLAGFALAETAVGIDIEPLSDPGSIHAVLTEAERATLAALPAETRPDMALRYWTAKEAYLKALGIGLARDPATLEVVAGSNDGFTLREAATARRDAAGQGTWTRAEVHGCQLLAAVFRMDR